MIWNQHSFFKYPQVLTVSQSRFLHVLLCNTYKIYIYQEEIMKFYYNFL